MRPKRRAFLASFASFASFAFCIARSLRAESREPVSARLEWRQGARSENCIDAATLARAVQRRWRREVFTDDPRADIVVSGTIDGAANGGWQAVIELHRANGESLGTRTLSTAAQDCSSLDDSVALATGLMVDVSRRLLIEEHEGAATSGIGTAATPIAIPKETGAARAPWHVEPDVGVEGALGLVPGVAAAGRVGIALEPARFFRIEAAAALWFPHEERDAAGRGGHWSAVTAELAVCPLTYRRSGFAIHGCVAQRFGQIRARGLGFDESEAANEPIWTVGASAVVTQSIVGPLAVRLGVGAEVPLVRYRFVYSDASGEVQTVRRMAPVVGSLDVGLSIRW